jgi:ATP-dependent DNA helicase PIF1
VRLIGRASCTDRAAGKSYVIWAISQALLTLADDYDVLLMLKRAAPTGIAAFNIAAGTLHSLLRISPNRAFEPLAAPTLKELQASFEGVHYLIVDEKSMVGLAMWGRIDKRLREVFPARVDRKLPRRRCCRLTPDAGPFGGVNVVLFGDYEQLPAIGDTSVCHASLGVRGSEPNAALKTAGVEACRSFQHGTVLVQQMRQRGDDDAAVRLRAAIAGVCLGQPTVEQIATLSARELGRLPDHERAAFVDALHLFPTRAAVADHNSRRLLERTVERRFVPIVRCPAKHTGGAGARAANDDDGGLEAEICLGEHNTRAMSRRNLWTAAGLTNGTMLEIGPCPAVVGTADVRQCTSALRPTPCRASTCPRSSLFARRPTPARRGTPTPTASR